MIAAFILYSILLGAFAAAAAWLIEAALAASGKARRNAWIAGIAIALGLPLGMAIFQSARPPVAPAVTAVIQPARTATPQVLSFYVPVIAKTRVAGISLDSLALGTWGIVSFGLLSYYGISLRRLARNARRWPTHRLESHSVTVSLDVGPAVFGWWQPRVVFPRWLLTAPGETQRMALRHEHEHLVARDPQILTTATLLFALFPWNVPLAWMLRRLRFAMEVDCDARVVRGGADPASYGEALLYVSQRQAPAPATSIALIERPSQLERRINIMFASPRRYPALIAALSLALAGSCLFAATSVDAPTSIISVPIKPAPSAWPLGRVFEQLLNSKFPGLLEEKVEGTPVIVALINEDGSITRAEKFISPEPMADVNATKATFARLGLDEASVPYVGNMGIRSPNDPSKVLLIVYTEFAKPGETFVSRVAPDTRAVDREIFNRYFPAAAKEGVPAGAGLWVLLDHEGHVLLSGQESISPPQWNRTLESRFPGIRTEGVTVTPLTNAAGEPIKDRDGKNLQLHCVWLAPGSPSPAS
jgi:beta-lactamase regulating signal transducer with metallopeptidase domain